MILILAATAIASIACFMYRTRQHMDQAPITALLLTGTYILTLALLFFYNWHHCKLKGLQTFYFGALLTISASWFMPFFESMYGLPAELLLLDAVSDKWTNLNLEKFLFITGFIPEVTGHIFTVMRLAFICGLLSCLFMYRATLSKNIFLFFAFFITTLSLCFPNYWPQYQIFLIIPLTWLTANAIKHHDRISMTLLTLVTLPLLIPELLWQEVLEWDAMRHELDVEIIGRESYLNGAGITLLKYSPRTWVIYYLYEYRALTPVVLWILQVLQIRKHART